MMLKLGYFELANLISRTVGRNCISQPINKIGLRHGQDACYG